MIHQQKRRSSAAAMISIVALWIAGCQPFESADDYPYASSTAEDATNTTADSASSDGDDPDSDDPDIADTDIDDPDDGDIDDPDVITPVLTGEPIFVWSDKPSDSIGDGSAADPFLTLELALEVVRADLNADATAQFVIFLAEGAYDIPPHFLGHPNNADPNSNADPLNFTGVHLVGGFASTTAGPTWNTPPTDEARSTITLLSSVDPLGFDARPALGADFEGTALSHIKLIPSEGFDVLAYDRVTLHATNTKVVIQRSDIWIGLALDYAVGVQVDADESETKTGLPVGQLILDHSTVHFPHVTNQAVEMVGTSLYGAKTHGGVLAITDSDVSLEQLSQDDFGLHFSSITSVYGEGLGSRLWLNHARVHAGFALNESVAISCIDGCALNLANSEANAATKRTPDQLQVYQGVGIQLYSAGRVSITDSLVNQTPTDTLPVCQAQQCTGVEMWGSTAFPTAAQLDLGPQVSNVGFVTSCDRDFFGLVIERSALGGAENGSQGTALFVEGDDTTNAFASLICVNASRLDPGQCVDDFGEDGACYGAVIHNPLIALIHNNIIYGGDAASSSVAVEVSTIGTYRYIVLANNYLHGGRADSGRSVTLQLSPGDVVFPNTEGDFTSGVLVLGNHIHPGVSAESPVIVQEVLPFNETLSVLRPLAFMGNNFQIPANMLNGPVLYRKVSASGQEIDLTSPAEVNGGFDEPFLFFLNAQMPCAPFDLSNFRRNRAYIPVNPATCVNLGVPYKDLCDGDSPPEGFVTWLPWGDIQGKPRICQPLFCGDNPGGVCEPRWGGDHSPDFGPLEGPTTATEPCPCSLPVSP